MRYIRVFAKHAVIGIGWVRRDLRLWIIRFFEAATCRKETAMKILVPVKQVIDYNTKPLDKSVVRVSIEGVTSAGESRLLSCVSKKITKSEYPELSIAKTIVAFKKG